MDAGGTIIEVKDGRHSYACRLQDLRTHYYWAQDSKGAVRRTPVFYYQGLLKDNRAPDGEPKEGLLKDNGAPDGEPVSIVCFGRQSKMYELVVNIHICSNKVNHSRVLRTYFAGYDEHIKRHIICFERFEGFFGEEPADSMFFRCKNRQGSKGMLMHPHPDIQLEIAEVTTGINKMHLASVSNKFFDMGWSFVWCNGGKLKTFATYSRAEMSRDKWILSVRNDLDMLREFLDKDVLIATDDWENKTWFLKCFDKIHSNYPLIQEKHKNNLDLISLHPFLMRDKNAYLENFSTIRHAIINEEHGPLDLTNLKKALDGIVIDLLVRKKGTGTWEGKKMHNGLEKMIEDSKERKHGNTQMKGDEGYKIHRAYGLLHLLRDCYEHGCEYNISMDQFFDEVVKHWPLFNGQLHMYAYGATP